MEKKFKFLARTFFGASDNPSDDVNPYEDLDNFLNASVGSLNWGHSENARERTKLRFSYNYNQVLVHYGVTLLLEDIFETIKDDEKIIRDIVNEWIELAKFN